jgi:hypothetical protein
MRLEVMILHHDLHHTISVAIVPSVGETRILGGAHEEIALVDLVRRVNAQDLPQ